MEECSHEKLYFGSGGYYIFCDNCSRTWVAINPPHDNNLCYEASGDGLTNDDYRVKEVDNTRTTL